MHRIAFIFCLLVIALFAQSKKVAAQDIDIIINNITLESLERKPNEVPIAFAQIGENKYAIMRLGARTYFVDKFDAQNKLIKRTRPLPLYYCGTESQIPEDASFTIRHNKDGIIEIKSASIANRINCDFYIDNDWNIISVKRGEEGRAVLWTKSENTDFPNILKIIFPPSNRTSFNIIDKSKYAASDFNIAIESARNNPKIRALILNELKSNLGSYDWRDENISVRNLNDAGFYLSQSNECADLLDAAVMLRQVLARDPGRHVVHLNIADLDIKMRTKQCRHAQINENLTKEHYRQYCQAMGPRNIPPITRRKIISALNIRNLNLDTCRPKYDGYRAIDNNNETQLRAALNDEKNNIDEFGYDNNNLLGYALAKKNGPLARIIIENGANPNISNKYNNDSCCFAPTPIARAIYNLDVDTAKLLLSKPIQESVRNIRYAPLPLAAGIWTNSEDEERAKLEIIRALLNSKNNLINTQNENGENTFYTAANSRSGVQILQMLFDTGININAPNKYGSNALFSIPPFNKEKSITTLEFLLAHGANPNQQNQDGETPIVHVFNYTGANEETLAAMVSIFLRAGANPNIANHEGASALSKAAWRGMADSVDELIKYGAKLPIKKQYERDTLQFVEERISGLERDLKSNPNANYYCENTSAMACLTRYQRVRTALLAIK